MSYLVVRNISVKDNRVFVKGDSNNVWPRDYKEWECESLTKILKEEGRHALDVEILSEYESGNFQGGSNKYTRALKALRNMPEYERYNWRTNREEYQESIANDEEGFKRLLIQALSAKLPHDRFIISKEWNCEPVYLKKRSKSTARWTYHKSEAKIFNYLKEAKDFCSCFPSGKEWTINKIA